MNIDLLKNNYIIIPEFINPKYAKDLEKQFHLTDAKYKFPSDEQAPNSSSVYNYLPALELLANKTSHVSEIVGEMVLPTYVYSRIYRNGSVLTKHTDRPACEISVTLHLGGDRPWAIWIETPEKEKRCVTLNSGDGMIYLGCIAPHWRDKFDGKTYTQFFLHYVRSRGCCNSSYFDNESQNDDADDDFLNKLIGEYKEMKFYPKSRQVEQSDSSLFFDSIKSQQNKILNQDSQSENNINSNNFSLVTNEDEKEEFIEFDDVVLVNKNYSKFLKKEDSPSTFSVEKNEDRKIEKTLSEKKLSDFIFYKEEFIDPDFCDQILEEYANSDLWEPSLTGSGLDPDARRCSFINISDDGIIDLENPLERKKIDEKIYEYMKNLINEYQQEHPDFELEIQEDSGYELLKYEEGDFYVQHSDSFKEQPRALTVIMSMNNAYDGGEVALFNRELVYKMDAGDILVFPSSFMYPHEIMPVTSGTRFSLITWIV